MYGSCPNSCRFRLRAISTEPVPRWAGAKNARPFARERVYIHTERIGTMRKRLTSIALAIAAIAPSTATAYDPIVLKRGWYRAASADADDCRGEVGTNGQFYVISVTGFVPNQAGRLTIDNGDMVPIDRPIRIRPDGSWQQYYIPLRLNGEREGTASARVSTPGSTLALTFRWRRKGADG